MNKLLIIFIILNIINVIIQTVKSIATIKCGKAVAAIINAIAYGLYTIVIIYMTCALPIYIKAVIVALCNLVGVYVVKWLEEKSRKDKLWKIEIAVYDKDLIAITSSLKLLDIPHSVIYTSGGTRTIINAYSETQATSLQIKELCKNYNVKYFITETKAL